MDLELIIQLNMRKQVSLKQLNVTMIVDFNFKVFL